MNRAVQRTQSSTKKPANPATVETVSLVPAHIKTQQGAPTHLREGRLDSWKEVALHLGRDVRTVQRWEKSERLPVHRHIHSKNGSVYAFRSELDAWRDSRSLRTHSPITPESISAEAQTGTKENVLPHASRMLTRTLPTPTWKWVDGGAHTVLLYCSDSLFAPTVLHFTCPARKFSEELTDGMDCPAARRDRVELRSQLVRQR